MIIDKHPTPAASDKELTYNRIDPEQFRTMPANKYFKCRIQNQHTKHHVKGGLSYMREQIHSPDEYNVAVYYLNDGSYNGAALSVIQDIIKKDNNEQEVGPVRVVDHFYESLCAYISLYGLTETGDHYLFGIDNSGIGAYAKLKTLNTGTVIILRAFVDEEWRGQGFFKYMVETARDLMPGAEITICSDAEKSHLFAGATLPEQEILSAQNDINAKIAEKMGLTTTNE